MKRSTPEAYAQGTRLRKFLRNYKRTRPAKWWFDQMKAEVAGQPIGKADTDRGEGRLVIKPSE